VIDIHSHFLPNLDDGAKSWDTTLEMYRIAACDGASPRALPLKGRMAVLDVAAGRVTWVPADQDLLP